MDTEPLLPSRPSRTQLRVAQKERIAGLRVEYREFLAEFLATFLLVLIGDGVVAQTMLSRGTNGSWLGINLAWAGAVFLGTFIAGPISGSHINPAVTIALATFKGFKWEKVPTYIAAQLLGGFCGAAAVYLNYSEMIEAFDGPKHGFRQSAGIFSTYPAPGTSLTTSFISEFTASWILMLGIMAITSQHNSQLSAPSGSLGVFILLLCIGAAFGWQTGYAINAARDLAPRMFASIIYGKDVWTSYAWIPVVAPVVGCLAGAGTWTLMIGENRLVLE